MKYHACHILRTDKEKLTGHKGKFAKCCNPYCCNFYSTKTRGHYNMRKYCNIKCCRFVNDSGRIRNGRIPRAENLHSIWLLRKERDYLCQL